MDIIAKHLDRSQLKYPIHKIETICAFSGKKIQEAIKLKDTGANEYVGYHECPKCGQRNGQINNHLSHIELCDA
jgi:hypothetical protein